MSAEHAQGLERGVLAPRTEAPVQLARGARLFVDVRSATGLTPPPGIQNERALRGFAMRVCADGLPLPSSEPVRVCTPLSVRDVRPRGAHSRDYRVELAVPTGLAPGSYDLDVRFPGGSELVRAGVRIDGLSSLPARVASTLRDGLTLEAPLDSATALRVHLGAAGLAVEGGRVTFYPRHRDDCGFAPGSVAIVKVAAGGQARLKSLAASRSPAPVELLGRTTHAAEPLALAIPGPPESAAGAAPRRVYWWFSAESGAEGEQAHARFDVPGRRSLEAVALDREGRTQRWLLPVEVLPRVPTGCALGGVSAPRGVLGLLLVALSWKLAAGRRAGARRWNSAPRTSVPREP